MTGCALALVLLMGCAPVPDTVPLNPAPPQPAADRWLAEDKLRHFSLSFAATQMTYGGARMLTDRDPAVPLAAGTALLLGVAKEVRDARAGGAFSLKDLVWDAAGVALSVAFIRRIP